MAKFGNGGVSAGSGMATSPRPVPRPAQMPGPTPAARPGMFPGLDAKQRYEMISGLLGAAAQGAAGSNSPLLAGLTPILAAMVGGKAGAQYNTAQASEAAAAADRLGVPASARQYLDVVNDPTAPEYLKNLAEARIKAAMTPPPRGGGRTSSGGGGTGTGTGTGGVRLYGEIEGADGILYGRPKNSSTLVPYLGPDGQPMRVRQKAPAGDAAPEDDPLNILTDDDPLGLR